MLQVTAHAHIKRKRDGAYFTFVQLCRVSQSIYSNTNAKLYQIIDKYSQWKLKINKLLHNAKTITKIINLIERINYETVCL